MDILLIEDNPGDARLTLEAFQDANKSVQLHVVPDGLQAIAFLQREGAHARAPRPKLILLDLNLPKLGGHEVLARVKGDDSLKAIPTVIITASDQETDIVKSHQLQANCYVLKPSHFDAWRSLMQSINMFWLTNERPAPQTLSP